MSKRTVLINSILHNYKSNGIYRSISVLDKKSKNKIVIISGIQVVLSLLDLIAIGLVGVLGSLSIRGIKSETPGDRVNTILSFFRVSNLSFQSQVAIIGLITASLLTFRTLLTIYFSRRILYFLSSKSAEVSRNILEWHLNRNLIEINTVNSQQFLFSVTTGVRNIVLGVIGSFVNIITDFSLLLILFIGLFIVDKIIALSSLFIFGSVGLGLFKIMKSRAQILGSRSGELAIESNQKILEVLSTYREAVVKDRRPYYIKVVGKIFQEMSAGLAEMSFMPNISKYVIETTIVISAFIICGIEFFLSTSISAIATLSIFLAAGTRIAPSILRLQQSTIAIKGSLGTAKPTFELINKFTESAKVDLRLNNSEITEERFLPEVRVRNVFFKYDNKSKFELRLDELHIKKGESVAFVGMSGSGKTTLIDIILGVVPPISGEIEISGVAPGAAFRKWPGEIAYIPQEVRIIDGSIRNNIELGYPKEKYSENQILESLDQAEMRKFVENLEFGIDTQVGESGAKISGGQRQRIGIARALISNPNLLVMDEATSSLDSETELLISNSIRKLKGKTTLIIIAHRLSTIKDVDVIYYMKNGKIEANGNFHELRKKIPDFDKQAKLMGL